MTPVQHSHPRQADSLPGEGNRRHGLEFPRMQGQDGPATARPSATTSHVAGPCPAPGLWACVRLVRRGSRAYVWRTDEASHEVGGPHPTGVDYTGGKRPEQRYALGLETQKLPPGVLS